MNIIVCIKVVPDDEVRITLADDKPDIKDAGRVVNVFDRYAVEMALRFCEEHGGEVTVVTLGDEAEVRQGLIQLLAAGVKYAYVAGPIPGDEAGTAEALSHLIGLVQKEGVEYDLILCGKESTDEISSQVGAILAEKMELPVVTNIVGFERTEDQLIARKETEEGYEYYEAAVPAVFTVGKTPYDLRYPSIKSKLQARKAQIPVRSIPSVAATVTCIGYMKEKRTHTGILIKREDEADAVDEALQQLMADQVL